MDYKEKCEQVCRLVETTSDFIREERRNFCIDGIETKGVHNYVTYVDKASEEKLVKGLSSIVPEAGFIVEEQTSVSRGEQFNWVVDPIDGTTNFIHGAPPFAISVALMEGPQVVLGVILEIFSGELFYAWKGGKAYLNDKEIHVSNTERVKDSLLATGFPYTEFGHIDAYMKTMSHFMKNSHGLRRLGSAATDLAYVACGRYDGFYEYGLSPWDVAAGAFIVACAGGGNVDFKGGENFIFGSEIISANPKILDELRKDVAGFML